MSYPTPFTFEIEEGRPLLVLSCSSTKRNSLELLRFVDLYDGPLWRDVRGHNYPASNVAAISALHGFLEPGMAIKMYDCVMDADRSERMCGEGDHVARFAACVRRAGAAFVVGGGMYQELARTAIRLFPDLGPMVSFASGSFLQQRKQLGEWLRANMGGDLMKTPQVPAMPGMTPLGFDRGSNVLGSLGLHNEARQDQAAWAQRKADAPLRPKVAQASCDVGLFGDSMLQSDLVDRVRR